MNLQELSVEILVQNVVIMILVMDLETVYLTMHQMGLLVKMDYSVLY